MLFSAQAPVFVSTSRASSGISVQSTGPKNIASLTSFTRFSKPGSIFSVAAQTVLKQPILNEENRLLGHVSPLQSLLQIPQIAHELQMFFGVFLKSRVSMIAHGSLLAGKMQPSKVNELLKDRLYGGTCARLE